MALRGINHVVLKVRDLERSEAFYRLLGFVQSGSRAQMRMRFYHGGGHAHDLALMALGPDAPAAPREAVGLYHFCVTVDEEAELGVLKRRLEEAGHRVSEGIDHIVSRSVYTRDPDGNSVELTWDTPESDWRGMENPFVTDRPYDVPAAPDDKGR